MFYIVGKIVFLLSYIFFVIFVFIDELIILIKGRDEIVCGDLVCFDVEIKYI